MASEQPNLPEVEERLARIEKELQEERKRRQEFEAVIKERDKLKDRFWRERLTYIAIIVALLAVIVSLVIALLTQAM
jgi:hypothetical protein